MPDEIEETQEQEEVQAQEIDADEEAAFEEATGDKPKKASTKADKTEKAKESTSPEQKGEETQTDEGEKPKEEETPQEKTAREIADERAKKLIGEEEPLIEDEEEPAPPPEKETPKPKVETPKGMTREQIAQFLGSIQDDDLPDGEVIIGDQSINLRAYKEDFPDEYAAVMVLAGTMARKMVDEALGSAGYAKGEDLQQVHAQYQEQIEDLRFWQQVSIQHPDALKLARSKDFTGWLGKQSGGIRALASSIDPEDGIAVINLYKEEQAKAKVTEHDDKARGKKKEKDDLHKGTLRAGPQTKKGDDDAGADNEQAGFELFFQKKQQRSY